MDSSLKDVSSTMDSFGQNAFHSKIRSGFTKQMRLMLEEGVNFEAQDINGLTALHIAAKYTRTRSMKILLKRRAEVMTRDRRGQTPLHMAALQFDNKVEVVTMLMMKGADVNVKDHCGRTPLHLAASNDRDGGLPFDVIQELLNWGASIDAKDDNGETFIDTTVCRFTVNRILKEHFVKLKCATLPCNSTTEFYLNLNELNDLKVSCLKELEIMKTKKLGRSTLYDVFSKYSDPTYIPNYRLGRNIKSCRFLSQFPIYGSLIRATYMQAKARVKLLNTAQVIFTTWFPVEIGRHILSLVSNEDLKNVIKSAEETTNEYETVNKYEIQSEQNLLLKFLMTFFHNFSIILSIIDFIKKYKSKGL